MVPGVQTHPQRFWFVKTLGKISNNLGKESSLFFNIIDEITLCYWVYKQKLVVSEKAP